MLGPESSKLPPVRAKALHQIFAGQDHSPRPGLASRETFWYDLPAKQDITAAQKRWPQIRIHFAPDLCAKKAILNKGSSFGGCGVLLPKLHGLRRCPNKARKRCVQVTTKSAFQALGEPMSLALVQVTPRVEALALPKFAESGNFGQARHPVEVGCMQSIRRRAARTVPS
jgi:hypothetical protein